MRTETNRLRHVMDALAAPFGPEDVKAKPQSVQGNRALAIFYIDARAVQDRLDEVFGLDGWKDQYEFQHDGTVKCILSFRIDDGEWITREDVGGQSEQPDGGDRVKSAVSDALKRAAVKLGIGRFLYAAKPTWWDYDPQKRKFVNPPTIPALANQKPAAPAQQRQQPAKQTTTPPASAPQGGTTMPKNGAELESRLKAKDDKLAQEKKIQAGDLIRSVILSGKNFNLPEDLSKWDPTQFDVALNAATAFIKSLPASQSL